MIIALSLMQAISWSLIRHLNIWNSDTPLEIDEFQNGTDYISAMLADKLVLEGGVCSTYAKEGGYGTAGDGQGYGHYIYIYIEGLSWCGVELYIACFECIDNTVWHTS